MDSRKLGVALTDLNEADTPSMLDEESSVALGLGFKSSTPPLSTEKCYRSLSVRVVDARGLPKRAISRGFHVDLLVGERSIGRTSTKAEANPFWGEQFQSELSHEEVVLELRLIVNSESKQLKKKSTRNSSARPRKPLLIGNLAIEADSLEPNCDHQRWFTFERPHSVIGSKSSISLGRVELNLWLTYVVLHVLPAAHYTPLIQHLFQSESVPLKLIDSLPAEKQRPCLDLLTEIAHLKGHSVSLFSPIFLDEYRRASEKELGATSRSSKFLLHHLKSTADRWLNSMDRVVKFVRDHGELDCDLSMATDPSKINHNTANLTMLLTRAMEVVYDQKMRIPSSLRVLLSGLLRNCERRLGHDKYIAATQELKRLVSQVLLEQFFTIPLKRPCLIKSSREKVSPFVSNLLLTIKVLAKLSRGELFDPEEGHFGFLNVWLDAEIKTFNTFIDSLFHPGSSPRGNYSLPGEEDAPLARACALLLPYIAEVEKDLANVHAWELALQDLEVLRQHTLDLEQASSQKKQLEEERFKNEKKEKIRKNLAEFGMNQKSNRNLPHPLVKAQSEPPSSTGVSFQDTFMASTPVNPTTHKNGAMTKSTSSKAGGTKSANRLLQYERRKVLGSNPKASFFLRDAKTNSPLNSDRLQNTARYRTLRVATLTLSNFTGQPKGVTLSFQLQLLKPLITIGQTNPLSRKKKLDAQFNYTLEEDVTELKLLLWKLKFSTTSKSHSGFASSAGSKDFGSHRPYSKDLYGSTIITLSDHLKDPSITYTITPSKSSRNRLALSTKLQVAVSIGFKVMPVLPSRLYRPLFSSIFAPAQKFQLLVHIAQDSSEILSLHDHTLFAQLLVSVAEIMDCAPTLLATLAEREIETTASPEILFRGNTLASKGIDYYLKLVASPWLDCLNSFLTLVSDSKTVHCELADSRLQVGDDVQKNANNLELILGRLMSGIFATKRECPRNIRVLFHRIQAATKKRWADERETSYTCVSGFIFLRFFVPAVVTPHEYGLVDIPFEGNCAAILTLVARVVQKIANFSVYPPEQFHFHKLNPWMNMNMLLIKDFIDHICNEKNIDGAPSAMDTPKIDFSSTSAQLLPHFKAYRTIFADSNDPHVTRVMKHIDRVDKERVAYLKGDILPPLSTPSIPTGVKKVELPAHIQKLIDKEAPVSAPMSVVHNSEWITSPNNVVKTDWQTQLPEVSDAYYTSRTAPSLTTITSPGTVEVPSLSLPSPSASPPRPQRAWTEGSSASARSGRDSARKSGGGGLLVEMGGHSGGIATSSTPEDSHPSSDTPSSLDLLPTSSFEEAASPRDTSPPRRRWSPARYSRPSTAPKAKGVGTRDTGGSTSTRKASSSPSRSRKHSRKSSSAKSSSQFVPPPLPAIPPETASSLPASPAQDLRTSGSLKLAARTFPASPSNIRHRSSSPHHPRHHRRSDSSGRKLKKRKSDMLLNATLISRGKGNLGLATSGGGRRSNGRTAVKLTELEEAEGGEIIPSADLTSSGSRRAGLKRSHSIGVTSPRRQTDSSPTRKLRKGESTKK